MDVSQRLNALRARMSSLSTSGDPFATKKNVPSALSQLDKYKRDIQAYQNFGVQPEKQKWYSKLLNEGLGTLRGMGTALYTYPRGISSGLGELLERQKEQSGLPQSAGIGSLFKSYNQTSIGDRLKQLIPNMTAMAAATQKGA